MGVLRWWFVSCTKCRWTSDRKVATRQDAERFGCARCGAPVSAMHGVVPPKQLSDN